MDSAMQRAGSTLAPCPHRSQTLTPAHRPPPVRFFYSDLTPNGNDDNDSDPTISVAVTLFADRDVDSFSVLPAPGSGGCSRRQVSPVRRIIPRRSCAISTRVH